MHFGVRRFLRRSRKTPTGRILEHEQEDRLESVASAGRMSHRLAADATSTLSAQNRLREWQTTQIRKPTGKRKHQSLFSPWPPVKLQSYQTISKSLMPFHFQVYGS